MTWEGMIGCRYFWGARATRDYPEEYGCKHPGSESGACGEEACPLIEQEDDDGRDA